MSWDSIKEKVKRAVAEIEENRKILQEQQIIDQRERERKREARRLREIAEIMTPEMLEAKIDHAIKYGLTKFMIIESVPSTYWSYHYPEVKIMENSIYDVFMKHLQELGLKPYPHRYTMRDSWGDDETYVSIWAMFP